MNFVQSFGFKIYSDNLQKIPVDAGECRIINTISPNSYGLSTRDDIFRESLKKSDYLVLDGVYFALASIFLNGKNIRKNQGYDLFIHFMSRANESHGKVFFLGASLKTLERIKNNAAREFPNLNIGFFSPPYKTEFSREDDLEMVTAINEFGPEILFVGMTCPKQEKWAYRNKEKLNCRLICCIGAVFDWYAGTEKKIAPIWWKMRLGWLIRAFYRPAVIKRWPVVGIFFWHLILAMLGSKKYRHGSY